MPDFLRPAVYPVLLTCIVGSLWMLAASVGADEDQRAMAATVRTDDIRSNGDRSGNDQYAELDPN